MQLIENKPLNTQIICDLINDQNDMKLVWPIAIWPFNHEQWKEVLDPLKGHLLKGHLSFLVYENNELIGHSALRKTNEKKTYSVSFLFIKREYRSKGYGGKMINQLELYAKNNLSAIYLELVVRTYNPRGIRCYQKCGFKEYDRENTLIKMKKKTLVEP